MRRLLVDRSSNLKSSNYQRLRGNQNYEHQNRINSYTRKVKTYGSLGNILYKIGLSPSCIRTVARNVWEGLFQYLWSGCDEITFIL